MGSEPFTATVEGFARSELEERCDRIEAALSTHPSQPSLWLELADAQFQLERVSKALHSVERALELATPDLLAPAMWMHAMLLAHSGRLSESAEALTIAASMPGSDAGACHAQRAALLEQLGRHDEAVRAYDIALAFRAESSWWNNRATLVAHLGRLDDALKSFDRALTHAQSIEDSALVLLNRAQCERGAGRLAEAVESLERALRLVPYDPDIWLSLGSVLESLRDAAGAERAYREATRVGPDDAWSWLSLSRALAALERVDEARSALGRALSLDSSLRREIEKDDSLRALL